MADRTKPARPPTGPPLSGATVLSSFEQTPYSYSSGSLEDTSERWAQIDCVLREELRSNLRFDIPDFVEAIFGQVLWLDKLAEVAFGLCRKGENPKYSEGSGWTEWPPVPSEGPVLNFLEDTMLHLKTSIENEVEYVTNRRRIYARPRDYFAGSGIKRRMNAGVEKDDGSSKNDPPLWEKILVVAELKSNPLEDHHELTFVELAQYAREVFLAQDRRFVLGFTLCGSIMRLWQFDRSGSSGSVSFDINKDGPRFVRIMLGYYLMSDKQLGVDPTIQYSDGKRYIDITREGQIERLVIIEDIRKQSTVVGRATTCWRAHCGENSSGKHLVIKDSWQYTERSEEGELIRKATENGVQNIARYYHHETVQIDGKDDDIFGNVRRGLMKGAPRRKFTTRSATRTLFQESFSKSMGKSSASQKSSRKRVSSPRPRSPDPKRSRSNLTMNDSESPNHDRIHRLVITYDPGKRIDEASSCLAIINGLLGAVSGHESLFRAGILHRDISTGNIMLTEKEDAGFLIDLDLAVNIDREQPSGAKSRTGTKVFMAISALYGFSHTFMHDLESIFWVLFWICVHYNGPEEKQAVDPQFEEWNYFDPTVLGTQKTGQIGMIFEKVDGSVTPFCKPLLPCLKSLHDQVFPDDKPRRTEDLELYSGMKRVFKEARDNFEIKTIVQC